MFDRVCSCCGFPVEFCERAMEAARDTSWEAWYVSLPSPDGTACVTCGHCDCCCYEDETGYRDPTDAQDSGMPF